MCSQCLHLRTLVNSSLGLVILGLGISIVGKFIRPDKHHLHTEMIEALRRISRGDFHVNLDLGFGESRGKRWQRHPIAQLADSINAMAANLKEMEELRQEFISNVSHEIGSPLTSISGFAEA
jgi:two-component system phosphate regulon sensor histidine kinase PhoR